MDTALNSMIEQLRSDLNVLKQNKVEQDDFDTEVFQLKDLISKLGSGQKVEIRAPTPKKEGPKITQADIDRWNASADKTDKWTKLLDNLQKELEGIEHLKARLHELEKKSADWINKE